jgi:hypothetical protein
MDTGDIDVERERLQLEEDLNAILEIFADCFYNYIYYY